LSLAACQQEQTSVAIHISAPSFTISTLQLSVSLGASAVQTRPLPATQSGRVVVLLPAVAEQVTVVVDAVDSAGGKHEQTAMVRSKPHAQVDATIDFAGTTLGDGGVDLLPPGDQGAPPDIAGVPTLSLLAGELGGSGTSDGKGTEARFNLPQGIAIAGDSLYIAEEYNNAVRKVGTDGTVTTLQLDDGQGNPAYTSDGVGIAYDGSQYLYVSEFYNCDILRISLTPDATGRLQTLRISGAGGGACGFTNGIVDASQMNGPTALAFDGNGLLWMVDYNNDAVRTFDPKSGLLATIAGQPPAAGATSVAVDGSSTTARFGSPQCLTIVGTKVYVTDGAAVRVIDTTQAATAGTYVTTAVAATAQGFSSLEGITAGDAGSLLILDDGNEIIHRVIPTTPPSFTTVAGNGSFDNPVDGDGLAAGISSPRFMQSDGNGTAWFTDGDTIRKLTIGAPWTVTTVAGIANHADNTDSPPRFDGPAGLAWDATTNIVYIADNFDNRIRAFQLPSGPLTTIAGNGASADHDDIGTAATLAGPESLVLDGSGHLFVGESTSDFIRKITLSTGQVQTVINASAGLGDPAGLAFDGDHTIYVSDRGNDCIRTLDSVAGTLAIFAATCNANDAGHMNGSAATAQFYAPAGLAIDRANKLLYVADVYNYMIRRIDLAAADHPVTTLSGVGNVGDSDNTTLALATFALPYGIAFDDATGLLYVADIGNSAVRKLDIANDHITTYIGDGNQRTDVGPLPAAINTPYGLAPTPAGLLVTTQAENALLLAK
ncbi:MAG TPA: hypothetical protein VHB97_22870, partial [Polyangia bacterium]|nr:hypothetical protein [Polyangia bacterium]